MKCPKCDYLGFETGDRCRNCGYDFSLMSGASQASATHATLQAADRLLRDQDPLTGSSAAAWLDYFDRDEPAPPAAMVTPAPAPAPAPMPAPAPVPMRASQPRVIEPPLPLSNPNDDDAPLVRLPARPRAPLSVRRTPDTPRLRAEPRPSRRNSGGAATQAEPVLAFTDEAANAEPVEHAAPVLRERSPSLASAPTSEPGRRLVAVAIDHAILLTIDVLVVYFTLRLAAMPAGDWSALPAVPLAIFLGMVKAAYFCVFTLVGGQTIGKMAARIRVIADDGGPLDPPRAIRRTCAGALSLVTVGLAFLPALMASDRRALHDRFAGTRVVAI